MLTSEPSKIKEVTWLSIRNTLVKNHGIRERIANLIVNKYASAIKRAAKFNMDATYYTECLIRDLKERSTEEEFEKLHDKNWRPPCKKCKGVQVVNISDDEIVDCDNCTDGTEPVDIFDEYNTI